MKLGRWASIRFHRWLKGDPPHLQHSHPWSFITFVLRGGYDDVGYGRPTDRVRAPAIRFRDRNWKHAVCNVLPGTCSIVVTGPIRASWRFWIRDVEVDEATWNMRNCEDGE